MLTVNEFMTVNPVTVGAETPITEVMELMKQHGYEYVPVVGDGKLVGLISEQDVTYALRSPYATPSEIPPITDFHQPAAHFMTPNPLTITPEDTVYAAAELLSIYNLGALPVLVGDMLVGLVTVAGLLSYFSSGLVRHFL